jgi:hypothetical protein
MIIVLLIITNLINKLKLEVEEVVVQVIKLK